MYHVDTISFLNSSIRLSSEFLDCNHGTKEKGIEKTRESSVSLALSVWRL